MERRSFVLILLILCMLLALLWFSFQIKRIQLEQKQSVVTTRVNLARGSRIQEGDLYWTHSGAKTIDEKKLLTQEQLELTDLTGSLVLKDIKADQRLSAREILIRKQGQAASYTQVLTPGMRAFSVAINGTWPAGLVQIGDRVDLLLTHHDWAVDSSKQPAQSIPAYVSQTVFKQMLVLDNGIPSNASSSSFLGQSSSNRTRQVTIEVTPKQAEMLAVLSRFGTFSLSVSDRQDETFELAKTGSHPTRSLDLMNAPNQHVNIITIIRGNKKGLEKP